MSIPYAEDAERYVLGCMLWTRDAVGRALEILDAQDFHVPNHRFLFRTLHRMFIEGEPIDPILVAERLKRDGVKGEPGKGLLTELLEEAGSSLHLEEHARLILNRAHARSLQLVTAEPHKLSDDEIESAAEQADSLLRRMRRGTQEPTRLLGYYVARDLEEIEEAGRSGEPILGISTGFPRLDTLTAGWHPGQLAIVGAQTGHGKTSLMHRFALEAAKHGNRVLFCSLEMTTRELRERIYAQEAHIALPRVTRGDLNEQDWKRLSKVSEECNKLPLLLCGKRGMTASDISAEARRVATDGLGMIVVDYLQLVRPQNLKAQR
ncbi:MAG TPA: DnaB-like helicase C-terminal domain-containing protein, partial [Candidatus Paceibacterota bacterium]|nr:DnaB-like helicase C-terminal domain-containing protein [Candidatus Paceibacterota bacterium]